MAKKKDNSIMRLTPSQDTAFRNFIGGANLFITGKGGSGKSFLVDHIKKWCASKGYNVATCAFMGIAALNVGGSTIHRLFRPGSGVIDRRNKRCLDKKKLDVLRKIDVFIIDEISTVRADLFSYVASLSVTSISCLLSWFLQKRKPTRQSGEKCSMLSRHHNGSSSDSRQ